MCRTLNVSVKNKDPVLCVNVECRFMNFVGESVHDVDSDRTNVIGLCDP